jgi:hypothetical protein
LWYLSDAAAEISADFMKNNAYRSYNNQARERWSQAFDDAIADIEHIDEDQYKDATTIM